MKILLDENLPRKLVAALRAEGHEVESIHTLRLQGLDNGKLYEFARDSFDLCFTRDSGFANNVRQGAPPSRLKLLRVTVQRDVRLPTRRVRLPERDCLEFLLVMIEPLCDEL